MKKNVSVKSLSFLFVLITVVLFSCKKEDNIPGFKGDREVFMGRNNIRIVIPLERDTINVKDSTTGVIMTIDGQDLLTEGYEIKETRPLLIKSTVDSSGVKREVRIAIKYNNFHISGSVDKERNFGFDATAVLYLSNYSESETDTIPLKYIPSVGNINGNKMFYMEEYIPESSFEEPYILVRYTGYKIRY